MARPTPFGGVRNTGLIRVSSSASFRITCARAVRAVVVDGNDLVDVLAVQVAQARDQRPDVHLLVVARDHDRHGSPQRLVIEQRQASDAQLRAAASARERGSSRPGVRTTGAFSSRIDRLRSSHTSRRVSGA